MKAKNSSFAIQNVLRFITLKIKPPATRPKHRKTIANSNMIDTIRMCDLLQQLYHYLLWLPGLGEPQPHVVCSSIA